MKQQKEKYFNLLAFTKLIIHLHANSPVAKAAENPKNIEPKEKDSDKISPDKISLNTLPKIKGTTIKKENFAEEVLSTPKITDVAIVAPDLDIPGRIAIA